MDDIKESKWRTITILNNLLKIVEQNLISLNYNSISQFIDDAIREKLEKHDIKMNGGECK